MKSSPSNAVATSHSHRASCRDPITSVVCDHSWRIVTPPASGIEVGELARSLVEQQRLDDEGEGSGEHVGEAIDREADAVIGDAVLLVVVGADLLAATTAAHLRPPLGRQLGIALAL